MQTEKDQATGSTTVRNDRKKSWNGREVMRLRLLFLAPLTIAILAIVTALMLALYWHEHQSVQKGVMRIRASAQDFYEDSIRYDARALNAVMDTLQRDPLLRAALACRDRQRLLRQAAPLFQELKQDYAITHFYFTGTDRVNLLRVHTPTRFGDRIDRITTLSAEENRTTSFGVELGPLGTFTLRLVTPWYDTETHELIGYVELGMEIDRVLQKLRDFFGVEVFVLVHKDRLDRNKWEDGMRTLGHPCDWERFPTVVLSSQTPQSVPTLLAERLARGELGDPNTIVDAAHGGASFRIAFLPLQDAGGNNVAHMALIADVSQETNAALKTVYAGSLTALAAGILLLGFFNWHVGRIGRRIENDAQTLEELATHDGLTGLYNHRAFYTHLEVEIARTQRYKHPLSLLMIDIDHFKQVNDIHGHQAGDAILQSLSKCLADQVRVVDQVYRYGGEELAVILPDTDTPFILAERIRAAVAATRFELDTGTAVGITVSIGIACFPRNAETGQQLVSAADTALYTAKREGRNRVCEYQNPMQAENYP